MKKLIYLGITLGIFFRFVWLAEFPPGINHDDVELLLSAKTLGLHAKDVSGVSFPNSLISGQLESGATGFPSLLLAPIFKVLPLNLFTSRLVFTLINLVTALFLFLVVKKISKKSFLAKLTVLTFLLTPWSFAYSRYALAAPISVLLITIGLYLFFDKNNKKILASSLFFSLAGLVYLGAIALIPLLVLTLLLINRNKNSFIVLLITWLIIGGFILLSKATPTSTVNHRSGEISIINVERFSGEVNDARRQSVDFPLKNIFINKYLAIYDELLVKYINAFNPNLLFVYGDLQGAHNFEKQGLLLQSDIILIPLGISALAIFPTLGMLNIGLILIAPIGAVLHAGGDSYIFRSFLLVIGFPILTALGLYKLKTNKLLLSSLLFLQIALFARFVYFYFSELPIKQADNFVVSERVLVNYLMREESKINLLVFSPLQITNEYKFFSKDYDAKLNFLDNCPEMIDGTVIVDTRIECDLSEPNQVIQQQKDAGVVYNIYNGKLCENVTLDSWRRTHKVSDYNLEKMSNEDLCNRWIFKY